MPRRRKKDEPDLWGRYMTGVGKRFENAILEFGEREAFYVLDEDYARRNGYAADVRYLFPGWREPHE